MKTLLSAIIFGLAVTSYANTGVIAGLGEADVLTITFRSVGCFHSYSKVYEVSGRPPITFSIFDTKKPLFGGRRKIGSAALTKEEILGLDSLFAFYRQGPSAGCTTVDEIETTLSHSGSVVLRERFVDGSCSTGLVEIAKENIQIRNQMPEERWKLLESIVTLRAVEERITNHLTKR